MNVRQWTCLLMTAAMIAFLASCGTSMSPAQAIAVQFDPNFPPPPTINTGGHVGIAAVVTNDPRQQGLVFSCAPSSACGTFSPIQVGSNVPTCYLAPAQVPMGNTVTVTATAVSDNTKFKSATITVLNGAGTPCP
jgi:hypothetical protein